MLLSSVASAALLAPRDLPADNTVVKTVTTTIHPEYTTTWILKGPTEEVAIVEFPKVVEVDNVTTTLEAPAVETNAQMYRTTFDIEIE